MGAEAAVESGPPIEYPMPHGFVARYAQYNRDIDDLERIVTMFDEGMNLPPFEYDQGQSIIVDYDSFADLVVGARCALEALKGDEGL